MRDDDLSPITPWDAETLRLAAMAGEEEMAAQLLRLGLATEEEAAERAREWRPLMLLPRGQEIPDPDVPRPPRLVARVLHELMRDPRIRAGVLPNEAEVGELARLVAADTPALLDEDGRGMEDGEVREAAGVALEMLKHYIEHRKGQTGGEGDDGE